MPAPVTVDFYFSPASPYAYLASTRMLPLQIETGCRVDWHPISGRVLIEKAGYDPSKAAPHSGQFQPEYRRADLERWARLYEVPYRHYADVTIPDGRRLALACIAARRFDAGQVFARALMKAIFVDGISPADDALCVRLAHEFAGIEPHLFRPMLDDAETERLHQERLAAALDAGCFGVPSFVVHRPDGGREMIFGNDRIPLLRQAVMEAKRTG